MLAALCSSGASVLGVVAGIAAVGYLRGAEILMGPFRGDPSGVSQVAVPEAARVFHRNSRRLPRFCAVLGGAQALTALGLGSRAVAGPAAGSPASCS